jgi:peroxiredoxin
MPSLVRLAREFDGSDFIILAVNINENRETVKKYVQSSNMSFPVLLDKTGKAARTYGIRGTPAHFLIDGRGRLIAYAMGARNWDNEKNRILIQYLIDRGK